MGKIYINQTYLTIKLDTGIDVSTASALYIKYQKPDGSLGSLTAILEGTTIVKYNCLSTPFLTSSGNWVFWAEVTFPDGRIGVGTPVDVVVYDKGN